MGLTAFTEVDIVAHGTFVADALNVSLIALPSTERTVTVNTHVACRDGGRKRDWLEHRYKAVVTTMAGLFGKAIAAEIEIGTIQAFVTDASDLDIAIVADGLVTGVAACTAETSKVGGKTSFANRPKCVTRVMPVLIFDEAGHAHIIIGTILTCNHRILGQI